MHHLYETIQRWSPLASTLPELVQRLVTIRQLHEQGVRPGRGPRALVSLPVDSVLSHAFFFTCAAMQFGQLLTHLDTTQQMMASSLKDNTALLTQVQTTMRENLATVEGNFASIDSRMKKLGK